MSTLALEGSSGRRAALAVGYADLVLLALALPVFVVAGWPLSATRWPPEPGSSSAAIQIAASRRVTRAQKRGDRRAALGILAGSTLARVWLITLAVLLVGLAEREAGLAAALLSAALFTVYLVTQFAIRLFAPGAV